MLQFLFRTIAAIAMVGAFWLGILSADHKDYETLETLGLQVVGVLAVLLLEGFERHCLFYSGRLPQLSVRLETSLNHPSVESNWRDGPNCCILSRRVLFYSALKGPGYGKEGVTVCRAYVSSPSRQRSENYICVTILLNYRR